jgi:uncharacterized protein (DUF488 family)
MKTATKSAAELGLRVRQSIVPAEPFNGVCLEVQRDIPMPTSSQAIYTIGQGRLSRVDVLERLRENQISYLVDVRSTPYSTFEPEFSRPLLERYLEAAGIRYVFMGHLLGGRPQDRDCYTDGHVDYATVRSKDFFLRGMARLKSAYNMAIPICLLCSEGEPSQCHRAKLIGQALAEDGIPVVHLLPDATQLSQSEVIDQLTNGQGALFDLGLKSRKAYLR